MTSGDFLFVGSGSDRMRKYALPCIISLIVAALYNIVDQIFIANASYLGSYGNAANTVVYPMTVIALALAVMVGDGTCAFVSLSLGKDRKEDAHRAIGNAVVLVILISLAHMKALKLTRNSFAFRPELIRRCLSLGMTSFFSQISLVAAMAAINNMIRIYGAQDPIFGQTQYAQIPMAVVGIVMKVFQIVISVAVGMSAGCIPIVGYNIGAARNTEKGNFICLQGAGKAMISSLLSLFREVVFGVGFALLLPIFFGLDGVLYSMPVSDVLTFVISAFVIVREMKELSTPYVNREDQKTQNLQSE